MQPSSPGHLADEPTGLEPAPAEELITISRWEFEALQARAASGSSAAKEAASAPAPAPIPASAPVAATLPAQAEPDARLAAREKTLREAVRDRELATALAGRSLVPGAASQLIKLWRDDFDVFETDGELKVTSRDGRSVARAIADRLEDPEYAHFRPATSRGGVATRGTGRTQTPGTPIVPRTLGEAVVQQWREGAANRADPASGPIGLRRR